MSDELPDYYVPIPENGWESRDILNVYSDRMGKVSLIRNEFLCGKVPIPCCFYSKSFYKNCFEARCNFPYKLEQFMKEFARSCIEKYSA